MIRLRLLSKFRSYLLPAVAAIILSVGTVACSSTGDEEPTPALDGAASGEESSSGNTNNDAAAGENANANADTEAANTARPEGEAAVGNNPIGNELNNAIGGDGAAANASGALVDGGAALNGDASSNANAFPSETSSGDAQASNNLSAADANTSNPFGAGANAAAPVPTNAAPEAPGAAFADPAQDAAASDATTTTASETTGESEAAPSGPTSLPEIGSKMAYYVMRGDTLGSISQKIYGSRGKWKVLQSENGLVDANKIYPGDVIYFTLTEASKTFAERYEMASRQIYTVSRGDSLSRLAAKFYGTQGAWRALWKENPQVLNPDRIRVGMVLSYRTASKVALKDENGSEVVEERDNSEAKADVRDDSAPAGEVLTAAAE